MPGDSKTEKATPKKRKDERKKGNIFFSKDVLTIASLFGSFYSLKILFPYIYGTIKESMMRHLVELSALSSLSVSSLHDQISDVVITSMKLLIPILLIAVGIGILATGIQTKFIFTGKNMMPQFSKLNPLSGIKNLFSIKNLVELLKNLLKVSLLFVILYTVLKGELNNISRTLDMDLTVSVSYILTTVMTMILKVGLVFAAIAAFDYFFQRWDYEKKIRMSKQDIKEEFKQIEGNPAIKGKIRDIQRQRARMRMMQAVPMADVIVRNPTHYAVALKYDINKDNAPIVVAKGQDELALRIIRAGKEHNVYIMENKPLARAIYATTHVGAEIPEEYYSTVAEILVYVYRLNHKNVT